MENSHIYDQYDVLIIGAGLSGSVLARELASKLNKKILVIDKRNHIGGNCFDFVNKYGIRMGKYGAHIFHTNNDRVWNYINNFSKWTRWDHKVIACTNGKRVPVPINITTVNTLCDTHLTNKTELMDYLDTVKISFDQINNSEQSVLAKVGYSLYEKLFHDYTIKQWNKHPKELNRSVLDRIPVHYNFDDRYFNDRYQALPSDGYTKFFEMLLNHENITVNLNIEFDNTYSAIHEDKCIIFTGPIDRYFKHLEKLEYRSLKFEIETFRNDGYYQENSVVNYPSADVKFTRIIEYKHFLHQKSQYTTIVKEIPCEGDEPYYPVPSKRNLDLYNKYQELAMKEKNVHFVGRLANYKYFNMDEAILNALEYFDLHFGQK